MGFIRKLGETIADAILELAWRLKASYAGDPVDIDYDGDLDPTEPGWQFDEEGRVFLYWAAKHLSLFTSWFHELDGEPDVALRKPKFYGKVQAKWSDEFPRKTPLANHQLRYAKTVAEIAERMAVEG